MRIRVLSDLHLEHHDAPEGLPPTRQPAGGPNADGSGTDGPTEEPKNPEADVVVLAGDIGRAVQSLRWARRTFPEVPVLLVTGNHEAYDHHLEATIAALRRASDELPPASRPLDGTGTYFLHRDAVRIGDVRFLGCTFWTRFRLFEGRRAEAMRACRGQMEDYQRIHLLRARRLLRPRDTDRFHRGAARFLRREAGRQDTPARATVVITHHAPSPASVDPRYEEDLTSAAFVARRDDLIRAAGPDAWIHGHVHASFDYRVGPTRILANPRGHPGENPAFRPGLVIEV